MKKLHSTSSIMASLAFLPTIRAFVPPPLSANNNRQPPPALVVLNQQQQPYYNEADGQYYYYNDSDGNYYTETGRMWTSSGYERQQQSDRTCANQSDDAPGLITSNFQQEMTRYSNVGIDYLSLARERAANKVQSFNSASTDGDWMALAEEKRLQEGREGEDDGWEDSLNDEGSGNDAASLGMGIFTTEGGIVVESGNEGEEPTLLL